MTTPKKLPTLLPLSLAIASALLAVAPLAQAQNLVELYESARAFDATYQSARAQYEANVFRADQAKAGLLPAANLAAGASRSQFENTNPVTDRNFSTTNATLSATQPLYR
ncbi:MAG: TolC family protein, partial [Lysobacterales bacterium]